MSAAETGGAAVLHAGFWRRGAAAALDMLVLAIPNALLTVALGHGALLFLAQLAVSILYFTLMHSSASQATLGKHVFRIKVTGMRGERIGKRLAAARSAAWWLLMLTFGIGLAIAAFTPRKQGLHDMLCGTLVVNRTAPPGEVPSVDATMPITSGVWAMAALIVLSPFVLWALLLSGMH